MAGYPRGRYVRSAEEDRVRLSAHDPRWFSLYDDEAARLRDRLGDFAQRIEHFGSTAVPGLAAKPTIDILVGAGELGLPGRVRSQVESIGYEFLGEDGRRPGRFFFRVREPISFNLSIVPLNSEMWATNLQVRDFLRNSDDWRSRYARVKFDSLEQSPGSLLGYQDGKRSFMDELRAAARDWCDTSSTNG